MTPEDILRQILSQCGLLSVLMAIVIIWLAMQLAKERQGRESDRAAALDALRGQMEIVEILAVGERKIRSVRTKMQSKVGLA